jgi:hypothetical protein
MLKWIAFAVVAAALFSCASLPDGEPAAPGHLVVRNIPGHFVHGIIRVTGKNGEGETFTYSSKTLQRISAVETEVKLYSQVSMIQKPFAGNGEYMVWVELYEEKNPEKTAARFFRIRFINGAASINWNEGQEMV